MFIAHGTEKGNCPQFLQTSQVLPVYEIKCSILCYCYLPFFSEKMPFEISVDEIEVCAL